MAKKSSSRKKGIQRFIPRHRIGGQQGENNERAGFGFRRSMILSFAKKNHEILLATCEKFHMISFKRDESGEFVPLTGKPLIWHYLLGIFCLAVCIQKNWATSQVFSSKGLVLESFLCVIVLCVYDGALLTTLSVLWRPKETMDLLNSWSYMAVSLKNFDPSSEFHPLDNFSACFKTIASTGVGHGCCLCVALLSIVSSDSPIFFVEAAANLGLFPEGVLPKWAWALMFAPLEFVLVQPFMLVGALNPNLLFMANGALDIFLQRIGDVKLLSLKSRKRVEQMYVQLELFNRIFQVWVRIYFPAWLLVLTVGVINAAFVAIRYTELPLPLYSQFPYIVWSLMVLIFSTSYDMLQVIRASEDILGELWQHQAPYFRGMPRAKRVEIMKRSKAMRPLVFPVGNSEFSLDLPISTWDEIINQTLFLLSL